jgi:hypothetical protein
MMRNNKFIQDFCNINTDSILEHGQPWSRFILLPENHPLRDQTKHALLSHPNILKVTEKLNQLVIDPESPKQNLSNFQVYGSFYWLLRFLADIGITAEDYRITSFIEQVMLSQLEDGQFMIRYHQKKQQAIAFVCIDAHLTYCLSRLGFKTSRTVTAAANYLATSQRFDGGWHCDQMKQNGERDQFMASCPSATIHSILALSQFDEVYQHILEKAVNQFVTVYESKSIPLYIYDSERQVKLNKLRYPPHYSGLDLLNVIYTFSFIPDLPKQSHMENLIDHALRQWDGSHWLSSAKKIPEWKNFDFGNNNKGSDWITSLVLTALERIKSLC